MTDSLEFDVATSTISVPEKAGVVYSIEGVPVEGSVTIEGPVVVTATLERGLVLAPNAKTEWTFEPEVKPVLPRGNDGRLVNPRGE